ncbi:unnamed protein product [Dovyalis caffra]|uniref:Uncharacterized protein n=1 Tax=Dovyalis caffra TaxID=77055 RepID=A0AAV1R036_9ROSI|nr:unnamed protein product [Dovyalis caffra]
MRKDREHKKRKSNMEEAEEAQMEKVGNMRSNRGIIPTTSIHRDRSHDLGAKMVISEFLRGSLRSLTTLRIIVSQFVRNAFVGRHYSGRKGQPEEDSNE